MDQNANLAEQREIVARILIQDEDSPYWNTGDSEGDAMRLAELTQAMDEWLTRGGFLPVDWSVAPGEDGKD